MSSIGNAQNCSCPATCRRMLFFTVGGLAELQFGVLGSGQRGSGQPRTNQESAMGEASPGTPPSLRPPEDRLDSWKEIAAYLNRDVTTVQRWEKREGMPVYRHLHDRMGSVYASRVDVDAWTRSGNLPAAQEDGNNASLSNPPVPPPRPAIWTSVTRWKSVLLSAAVVAAL